VRRVDNSWLAGVGVCKEFVAEIGLGKTACWGGNWGGKLR